MQFDNVQMELSKTRLLLETLKRRRILKRTILESARLQT